jgi:CubicO group peptidase (beta-lactamase class C family)
MRYVAAAFVLALVLGGFWLARPAAEAQADDTITAIRELAERRHGGDAPGGAVLVMQGDEVLISEGFGFADLEWREPATPGTAFRIGSITKVFTALAILQLAEDGQLALDAPVATYLPDLPGELGRPTIAQLLSHTSGLGDHFALPQIPEIMRNPTTPDGIIALMADQPLQSEPGTRYAYSNFGYVLLGRVITEIDPDHRTYADYVEQEIFAPLGMENSHYDRQSAIIPRRAAGYDLGPDGPVNTITFETSLADAAGALLTSSDDMAIFTRALLNDELISRETRGWAWVSAVLPDNSSTGYGQGFNVSDFMGRRVIWHSGSINGFQATWIHQPETDRTVAVFSNGYYRANTTDTARRILAILDGQPAPEFAAQAFADTDWSAAQGRYALDDGGVLQIHVQDGVRFNIDGGRWRELSYSGDNIFFSPDTLRHFIVERDAAGAVTGMIYVSTTLERQQATPLPGDIEGAQASIPLDSAEAGTITGDWALGSGDVVAVTQSDGQLFLALPYQQPQRIFRAAPWEYFSRSAPVSVIFAPGRDTATLNLYGNEMSLARQ